MLQKTYLKIYFLRSERYDLSAVGRMKFNRRVGRNEIRRSWYINQRRYYRCIQDIDSIFVMVKGGR